MPTDRRQRPLLEDIEPRILYAADTPGAPLASGGLAAAEAQRVHLDAETAAAVAPLSELVFVDTRIEDHATLVANVQAGAAAEGRSVEVILIGEGQDGIALVTDTLAQRSDIAAVHLLGHGESGRMQLGTSTLDGDALLQRAPQIASWGSALTADADLLLYGCDLAADADGRALAEGLAQLTGADVAASTDRTGTAALGGNWTLEMQTGAIEAQLAFDLQTQAQWQGVLATYTVTSTSNSGAGTLRQAIIDANANAGTDNINFALAGTNVHTIVISSALPLITGTVILDATTDDSFAPNGNKPAIALDGSNGNYNGLELSNTADGSTIRGLVIRNFRGSGIQINNGSDNNTIAGNYIGRMFTTGLAGGAGNGDDGIRVFGANNIIGGTTAADRNVVGGNTAGIQLINVAATGNQVIGNYIGLDATGLATLGNTARGVSIYGGASGNTVGGSLTTQRNVIAGNGNDGVYIDGEDSDNNIVRGNWIGVSADGATNLGNGGDGVYISNGADDTQVGGTGADDGNWIAGVTFIGVEIDGATSGTQIRNNRIGTDLAGTANWGTGQNGILIENSFSGAAPSGNGVVGNIVAFSGQSSPTFNTGIQLNSTAGATNPLSRNSVYSNGGLGIGLQGGTENSYGVTANDTGDADAGPNNLQNFPVLTLAKTDSSNQVTVSGTLNSTANSYFRIEFFASPTATVSGYGDGQIYLGNANVTTDGSGNATISATLSGVAVPVGYVISATATSTSASFVVFNETSEFSKHIVAISSTQATITVDTASDTSDGDTTSLSTLLASKGADGFVSLREAIIATNNTANGTSGADRIYFQIAGTGVHTITPATVLPTITNAVILDASTDDSFAANSSRPAIVLDGNNLAGDGLKLSSTADGSTVRGFVIRDFGNAGIYLDTGSDGNTIAGNYLGRLNTSGTDAGVGEGNGSTGIYIAGANSMIGGTTAADRNVVSGNASTGIRVAGAAATGNQIAGNFVGLTATGTAVLGNAEDGIQLTGGASGNTVGGATSAHRNVISGNADGVRVGHNTGGSNTNVIQNNYIGTDVTGLVALGNTGDGVDLWNSSSNNQFLDNVVSGNLQRGLNIGNSAGTNTGNIIRGNRIGLGADGTTALGNGAAGIVIGEGGSADGTVVGGTAAGQGNTIAYNLRGISVLTGTGISVLGNWMYANTELGIDLGGDGVTANDANDTDSGANNLQNSPVLTLARTDAAGQVTVAGTLTSNTGTNYYRVEFFASPTGDSSGYGEGQLYLGHTDVTTASGFTTFSATLAATVPVGYAITATATRSSAAFTNYTDTSEFARNVLAISSVQGSIVVDTAADTNDGDTTSLSTLLANKGADGFVSLREAIIATNNTANGTGGADRITFGIAGTGVHTITLGSVLPTITGAVLIDASTDDSFAVNGSRPAIVLDGNNGNFHGLTLSGTSDGSTIRGLVIRNLQQTGIILQAGADGNTIVGNYIGRLGTSGLAESTGVRYGLQVLGANNVIGGTTAADRNVFGGATDNALSPGVGFSGAGILVTGAAAVGNQIIGNYIGVAADGSTVVANDNGIAIDSSATNTLVGGSATNQRNIITGNHRIGLNIDGDATDGTVARGNWIGVNAAGTAAPGNGSTGLFVQNGADNTQVGGAGTNDGNWIANAGASGVQLSGNTALGWIISNTLVQGNRIGTDLAGTADWGSDDEGIYLTAGTTGTRILGNTIAFSGLQGIAMITTAGTGNSALGNSIYSNATLGIDLGTTGVTPNDALDADAGANNLQNFPVLSQVRTNGSSQLLVAGTLNSTASSYYRLEFFATATGDASGNGEGQTYLGFVNVTTDGAGNASFSTTLSASVPVGYAVSATATKSDAAFATFTDTSEFGAVQAVAGSVLNTVPGAQSIAEEVATAITGISVSAPFAATISTTLAVSNGTLLVSLAGGASIGGGANGSATLTLTGTVTQVNAALATLQYTGAAQYNGSDTLAVSSSDGAGGSDADNVAITVTAVNDAPVITSNGGGATASVSLAENTTAVTTVAASDVDGPALTYSISGGADAALFQINASTGALSFVTGPDFESPTDAGANNIYDVTVRASDGSLADTQAIAVTVTNVNDAPPVITSNGGGATASVSIAENGTAVSTVTATDADGPALTYSISGGADAARFQINSSTGVLTFTSAPDFEAPVDAGGNNVYDVTVQVSDGALADTQAIAVTVTNANDSAPVITSNGGGGAASLNVAENSTAVTTVTASDADASALTYSISGGNDAALFQINASTGVLTFVTAPNFESPTDVGANNVYNVTVQVSDGTFTDTQTLGVTVTDVNDNAPVITSNGGSATASVSVAENGTAVTTVTSTDADGPAPTYSIVGGADAALFQINSATGVLSFLAARDFESPADAGADNVYDVTVQASDGSATDTQAIAVTVTNLNDSAPVITSNGAGAAAAINVAENTTAVTTVTASDADGSALTYSISAGADAALFQIDASTGVLSFVGAPNFENPTDAGANNIYNVTVRVSDGVAADTQNLAVTVTDVNDNAPVITSNGGGAAASISIAENGTAVTTVTSTDVDGPAPVYSIAGGADAARFQIDAGTGVLTFVSAPDFESPADAGGNNVYDVTVQVSDGSATDTQAIAVTVTNANDNAPVITSNGGGATAAVNVAENATAVTTVTATDADGSALTYSISGGADAALFQINASTGALTFVAGPNYEAPADAGGNNVYDVTVRASDGSLTDTQAIAVTVTDANDNAPVITSNGGGASASISIAENGTAVTTVTSTDVDGPTPVYSIAGGADAALFQIDSSTGALSFLAARDFENPTDAGGNNVYDVTVQASDGVLTDTQAIAVTVTNVNDNAPAITSNGGGLTAAVNVAENRWDPLESTCRHASLSIL